MTQPSTAHYWIAINGSSCAVNAIPLRQPFAVTPTPSMLVGFPTLDEALAAQRTCLTAPIPKVREAVAGWCRRAAEAGDVKVVRPGNPGPQTSGKTVWQEL